MAKVLVGLDQALDRWLVAAVREAATNGQDVLENFDRLLKPSGDTVRSAAKLAVLKNLTVIWAVSSALCIDGLIEQAIGFVMASRIHVVKCHASRLERCRKVSRA